MRFKKAWGVGTNLAKLDTEKINKIIAKPWTADGSNFSSRIWKQKNQLVNELHNGLSQAFIRGTEPYDLTKQISERFKVSKGQAGRLVMTETAYFHSAAQIDAFKELGVKEYEITAVLDSRTSELCRDMDGKHLPVSEFKAGITAPPFHCWCRSTTVPYFNDEFTEEETRIARGADDKLYEVPYNMTYRQWKKAFVQGGSKDDLDEIRGGIGKLIVDQNIEYDNLTRNIPPIPLKDLNGRYFDEVQDLINGSDNACMNLIRKNIDKIIFAKTNCRGVSRYNRKYGIFINIGYDIKNERGKYASLFHEIGHNIDNIFGRPSISNKNFGELLKSDFEIFTKSYMELYNISEKEAFVEITNKLYEADIEESHIIADLLKGLSGGKIDVAFGHDSAYWNEGRIRKEAFAHFFGATALNNQKKLEAIKDIFPSAYFEFEKIISGLK